MNSAGMLALPLALAAVLGACGKEPAAPVKPDASYRVRGQVVATHGQGEDARATIAHEAIPEFKDRSGVPSGMPAMAMAFGIADNVDAKALVPGSKWELAFEVVWSREPALRITAAKPLPADTQLTLSSEGH